MSGSRGHTESAAVSRFSHEYREKKKYKKYKSMNYKHHRDIRNAIYLEGEKKHSDKVFRKQVILLPLGEPCPDKKDRKRAG